MPYLSYKPTIGRNSKFLDLTEEQREELGGIEYRSLKLLAKIVVGEFIVRGPIFWTHVYHFSTQHTTCFFTSLEQFV